MVVGTAERHIQIFNLTNPTTPYKVPSISFFHPSDNDSPMFLNRLDYDVATQMADPYCVLLLAFCKQWLRCWKCRGQGCYTVCFVLTILPQLPLTLRCRQIHRRERCRVSRPSLCLLYNLFTSFTHHVCRNNFSFKCHRRDSTPNTKDQALVYAVNDISFHPVHGTFSTAG